MHHSRIFLFVTAFTFYTHFLVAQQIGGNPPSIKWSQVNTPAARIIFPNGLDSTANRIANIITFIQKPTEKTIGNRSRKINIVLQTETAISNGYVGLAPFRSEFYLNPPQNSFDLGSLPWPDMLTIHEYRHVEQYSNFDVGLSKVMKVLFGDGGQALANGAAIPDWFYEGDAVFNESNVSKQGRGNLPAFFNGFQSLWKDGKKYNWMQLRNGSLKNYMPDHYELGYMLVAYGREKYGDEFWKDVTHDAASYKGLFYPLQKAVKKYAGISYKTYRKEALDYFKIQLNVEEKISPVASEKIKYLNEQYPYINNNGDILFIKNSFEEIPAFYSRKKGEKDQRIRISDVSIDSYFSFNDTKIVYASYRPDLRWGNRDYNEIKVLDVSTGLQHTVLNKTRSFSPDISQDGKLIVAVVEDDLNRQTLQIVDAETGEIKTKLLNKDGLIYTYPKFTKENNIVAAVRNDEGKMSIAEIDYNKNETTLLLPYSLNVAGFPVVYNDTLYFSYSFSKSDEIFAYTFQDKKLWKIDAPGKEGIGKYHPSVNNESLAWHTFTANGNKIVTILKSELVFEEMPEKRFTRISPDFGISSLSKSNANLLYMVPHDTFAITKYRKSFQLFNFHSIIPDISDPNYSLSLSGENILNTFQSELSLTYNQSEGYKRIGFSGTYTALFPYLTGGLNYTFDRRLFRNGKPVYFNQLEPYAGFSVPLNFSRGKSFTFLNVGSQYVFNKSFFKGVSKDSLENRFYGYLNNYLTFSHQVQKASKQIFPRFAQAVSGSYKRAVTNYIGNQAMLSASIYLPGLFQNNSIVLNGAWLKKDSLRQINFSSGFPFSRGYEAANFYQMYKWGANYHFPIIYPDAGFGNIVFLLRARANMFYDETFVHDFKANHEKYSASFRSAGTEISFDTKWWNQVKVSFGFRYSYLFDQDVYGRKGHNRWEIILPVNIFNQ